MSMSASFFNDQITHEMILRGISHPSFSIMPAREGGSAHLNNHPMSSIFNYFSENTPSFEKVFRENFPVHLLENFTFMYIEELEGHVPKEIVVTLLSPPLNFLKGVVEKNLNFQWNVRYTVKEGDNPIMPPSSSDRWNIVLAPGLPYLASKPDYHIPAPANDPIEIEYEGKNHTWPRKSELTTLAANKTTEEKKHPNGIYIKYKNDWIELAVLSEKKNEYRIFSPLAWWLTPSKTTQDFLDVWEKAKGMRVLNQRFSEISKQVKAQAEQRLMEHTRGYLAAPKELGIINKGGSDFVDAMIKSLEASFKEDGQIVAIRINNEAQVEALVGPIITMDKKNYGIFKINLDQQKAYAFSHNFTTNLHSNIGSSNHFCMGDVGDKEFANLVKEGRYGDAISFFIYRLSYPDGSRGYREHNHNYQPDLSPHWKENYRKFLEEPSLFLLGKEESQVSDLFLGEAVTYREVRKENKSKGLPYEDELLTLYYNQVVERLGNAGVEINDNDYPEENIDIAWDSGLLYDVLVIVDDNNVDEVWHRESDTYREGSRPVLTRDGRGRFSTTRA